MPSDLSLSRRARTFCRRSRYLSKEPALVLNNTRVPTKLLCPLRRRHRTAAAASADPSPSSLPTLENNKYGVPRKRTNPMASAKEHFQR